MRTMRCLVLHGGIAKLYADGRMAFSCAYSYTCCSEVDVDMLLQLLGARRDSLESCSPSLGTLNVACICYDLLEWKA